MARWLARPYPVAHLTLARAAIAAAAEGELDPLMALYRAARAALRETDPDEVREHDEGWSKASGSDKVARRAAERVADAWEGIVSVGARIDDPFRFRGFAWASAAARYELGGDFDDFAEGLDFPGVRPEDAALYVALPALVGLGPELPDEFDGALDAPSTRVADLLGLGDADVDGVDPLDGLAIAPEDLPADPPADWAHVVERARGAGLIMRRDR